jgi:hypothetical protein
VPPPALCSVDGFPIYKMGMTRFHRGESPAEVSNRAGTPAPERRWLQSKCSEESLRPGAMSLKASVWVSDGRELT